MVLLLASDVLLPVPASVVSTAAGAALGFAGGKALQAVSASYQRHGAWTVVLTRAVPVLAEAAVLAAGVARLDLKRFLALSTASNVGVAAAYAAVGALPLAAYWLAFRSRAAKR